MLSGNFADVIKTQRTGYVTISHSSELQRCRDEESWPEMGKEKSGKLELAGTVERPDGHEWSGFCLGPVGRVGGRPNVRLQSGAGAREGGTMGKWAATEKLVLLRFSRRLASSLSSSTEDGMEVA